MVAMAVSMTIIFDNSLADRPREELRPQVKSAVSIRRHLYLMSAIQRGVRNRVMRSFKYSGRQKTYYA